MVDLLAAAITVTLRRADEMGDAITARGGTGQISAAPSRPKARDWVALSIVAAVCALALVLELTVLGTSGTGLELVDGGRAGHVLRPVGGVPQLAGLQRPVDAELGDQQNLRQDDGVVPATAVGVEKFVTHRDDEQ